MYKLFCLSLCMAALSVSGCKAPPSVQKVIDEKEAEKEAAKPRLENPAQIAAQQAGREFYDIFIKGTWASDGMCSAPSATKWVFEADKFTTARDRTCRLAVAEELPDGRVAVAGYCPRIKLDEEPVIMTIGRTGRGKIVINSDFGGGPLVKCGS